MKKMEKQFSISQHINVLKKRWALITAITLIAALTSGILIFFVMKPVYQASTTLIVGKKAIEGSQQANQLLDYGNIMANQQLAKTYETIAKSRTVGERVVRDLNLQLSSESLASKVTVTSIKNTEVLQFTVKDNDPNLAASIANTMAQEFSKAIIEIKKVDSVSIIDQAVTPQNPVQPDKKQNLLMAAVLGLMGGIALAYLLEFMDNTIKDTADVEQILGLPVLGMIPDYGFDER